MKALLVMLIMSASLLFTGVSNAAEEMSDLQLQVKVKDLVDGRSTKPIFLMVYTNWCGACKAMKPMVVETEKALSDKLEFLQINGDVTQIIKAQGYPTTLIIFKEKKSGKIGVIERLGCPQSAETMTKELNLFLEQIK